MAATAMKPLPPASSTAFWRALITGSSGRGNGILSMTTSWQLGPGTSTPCQSDNVPKRQVFGSAAKFLISSPSVSSPWSRIGNSGIRLRSSSAASWAARMEENSPSVRPPAAWISSVSSSSMSPRSPSRAGRDRCLAMYRMPCLG